MIRFVICRNITLFLLLERELLSSKISWNVSLNTFTFFPELGDRVYWLVVISPIFVVFSVFFDASFLPFRAENI